MFFLRRHVILFGLLVGYAIPASSGDVLTNVEIHDGVAVGLRWNGSTDNSVRVPVTTGLEIPYGENRLEVVVPPGLLAPDARKHELELRQPGQRPRRFSPTTTSPDGRMTFDIPWGYSDESDRGELEFILLRDRRPFGLDEITLANIAYVRGGDHVKVVSINRYPMLSWEGCPAPCYKRPPGLGEITDDQWLEALEVVEVTDDGQQSRIHHFSTTLGRENPASILYVVDASASVLQETSGDPSRRMLEHFATFPDAAYGGDKVRHLDRLALLFFDSKIEGYYAGYLSGLDPEVRFFSPDEVAASWSEFCSGVGQVSAPLRLDHAWLVAAANALQGAGVPLPAPDRPGPLVCESGATTSEVLKLYRTRVLGQRGVHASSTDVLPALAAASIGLDFLRHDPKHSRAIRDNQEAIILISDGIDSGFMIGDERLRAQRFHQMRERLNGKRLFFIDIHSNLVLTKMLLEALRDQAPMYYAVSRSIDENIDDPGLALDLINLLVFPDDAVLRARLETRLETTPLEQLLDQTPVLRHLIRAVILKKLPLYDAAVDAIQQVAPASAETILRGRGYELAEFGVEDPSLWRLSGAFSHDRGAARATLKPKRIREQVDRLEEISIRQFHRLARDTGGLAVPMLSCVETLDDGRELSGPACAFRKILAAVRGTLHVYYELAPGRQIDHVEIRLTPRGREILAAKQMPQARLAE